MRNVLITGCLLLSALGSFAQDGLRPHIVTSTNAMGEKEYRDDRVPTIPDTSTCFIYVGTKQNGDLWLRLQVRHAGFERLDIEKIVFSKDERKLDVVVDPALLQFGNNGMVQWEWYDTPPSPNEQKAIIAMINEPGVKLTLIGHRRTVERIITENERLAMQNLLDQALVLGRVNEK